jgi:hypothetical protein
LKISPLRLTTSFFFQLNTCGHSHYIISSLRRGSIWRLQLLLVLASEVVLHFESRETYDYILLPQARDFPSLEGQISVFISHRHRVAQL